MTSPTSTGRRPVPYCRSLPIHHENYFKSATRKTKTPRLLSPQCAHRLAKLRTANDTQLTKWKTFALLPRLSEIVTKYKSQSPTNFQKSKSKPHGQNSRLLNSTPDSGPRTISPSFTPSIMSIPAKIPPSCSSCRCGFLPPFITYHFAFVVSLLRSLCYLL
jgi:hypothetical protein